MPENEPKSTDGKSTEDKSTDSYKLLLEKLKSMENTIAEQNKKIDDVTAMNRALLNGSVESTQQNTVSKKELEEKLIKGLRR